MAVKAILVVEKPLEDGSKRSQYVVLGYDDKQPSQGDSNLIVNPTKKPQNWGVDVQHYDQFVAAYEETEPSAVAAVDEAFEQAEAIKAVSYLKRVLIKGIVPPPKEWKTVAEVEIGNLKLSAAVRTPQKNFMRDMKKAAEKTVAFFFPTVLVTI